MEKANKREKGLHDELQAKDHEHSSKVNEQMIDSKKKEVELQLKLKSAQKEIESLTKFQDEAQTLKHQIKQLK